MGKNGDKVRTLGILTSGGDCPGLNAAIRGVAKAAIGTHGIEVIGILDASPVSSRTGWSRSATG